ncbi:MAG: twin-arginine translocase subunit TatC [Alphaproteobacteria bacterium]|nr:twin-arginine translocase subunit TatC [Alphaproteobacteria bacterium]
MSKNEKSQNVMPWMDHFVELRRRMLLVLVFFIFFFLIEYPFSKYFLNFLLSPLQKASDFSGNQVHAIFTNVTEGFFSHIKITFFSSVVSVFPIFLLEMWGFIKPGLYTVEKKIVKKIFFISPILFLIGDCFVFYIIMPYALEFFLSFQQGGENFFEILLTAKISEYISFVTSLLLAFGLSFQFPIILVILSQFDLIDSKILKKGRRYSFVLVFVLGAVLTPPDIFSQVALALPLFFLYEVSIYVIQKLEKNKKRGYNE